jgi:hypothetical protein
VSNDLDAVVCDGRYKISRLNRPTHHHSIAAAVRSENCTLRDIDVKRLAVLLYEKAPSFRVHEGDHTLHFRASILPCLFTG